MNKQPCTHTLKKCALFFCLILSLHCTGCSFGYLLHAAKGQFNLLNGSIEIEEALEDASVRQAWKEKLILIREIKEFGEDELGLKKTRNYETVYLNSSQAQIHILSASHKDRFEMIEYWFPIVGDIPYIGFFDLDNAKRKRDQLLEKDLDVYMGIADAYSTLGWFKDPVTLSMIQGDKLDLIETILHEMTHTTFYVKGQWEFNEGLAVLVGKYGSLLFAEAKFGPDALISMKARNLIDDELLFSTTLNSLFQRLEELYSSSVSYKDKIEKREEIFGQFLMDYQKIRSGFKTDRYTNFGAGGLDNAYLMIIGLYHKNFHVLSKILDNNNGSIRDTIHFFMDLGRIDGDILEKIKNPVETAFYED